MADINNQYHFLDYAGLALFWSNIKKIIEDNELVTAVALTDLDTRVEALFNGESENSIIVAGSGECSGVMKGAGNSATGNNSLAIGQNNEAISENSVVMGNNNIAGLKGWYYETMWSVQPTNSPDVDVYLSAKQKHLPTEDEAVLNWPQSHPVADESLPNLAELLGIGTVVSLVNDAKYDNAFEIISGSNGVVHLRCISNSFLPFTVIKHTAINDPEDYSIYCLSQPDKGMFDMGQGSIAGGYDNKATNGKTTAFGFNNHAYGKFSFVEGRDNEAGYAAHAEGRGTKAEGEESHAEGLNTIASGKHSHAEGDSTLAPGVNAHAEGYLSQATGNSSHAEGGYWVKGATGDNRVNGGTAEGAGSHAEGARTTAIANYSHAEGYRSIASGPNSHTEGQLTRTGGEDADRPTGNPGTKSGQNAHAEGAVTFAQGAGSHAEGGNTWASGNYSHAEGWQTRTYEDANNSHAEGFYTETTSRAEHAEGEYNKSNTGTRHSVGIGTSNTKRKNAHEIMDDGKHYIYVIGGYDGTNPTDSEDLATVIKNLIEITYTDLVNLRNNSKLTSGRLYRITDYITTTTQDNTQSASHPFDIIVLALSGSELSEQAWAIQSARDTDGYFANSKLSAWQIWYSLNNDAERFAWADDTNGKGVIYRMIDEFNNDIPYDFKNIQFVRYKLNAPDEYTSESPEEAWIVQLSKNIRAQFSSGQSAYIYAGIDADDRYWDGDYIGLYSSPTGETRAFYTFSTNSDEDASLLGSCYDNKMMFSKDLPNNVFFGNNCYYNSFGNNCNSNSFGSYCHSNSFDNYCHSNSFGNSCHSNSFGNSCYYNSFCNYCICNSFGNDCYYNSFGNYCSSNSFGDNCSSNSFGNYCSANTLGNECNSNTFGNRCQYNSFGNSCGYNSFRVSGSKISSLISNCRYNAFDDGCSYNIIYSANIDTSPYTYLENYHINRGVKGTDANPMLIDAQYLNSENVCNVYRKGDVAVVAYIQY